MSYTDEDTQIKIMQEQQQIANEDNFQMGDECFSENANIQSASLLALKTSDNGEKFQEIDELISKGEKLSMKFGIDNGLPYYKVDISPERKLTLYLNKEIIQYIYSYVKDGVKLPKAPNTWDVQTRANENYRLYLMKRDFENKVLKGRDIHKYYSAFYPKGTIMYGHLPHKPDELATILKSLQ